MDNIIEMINARKASKNEGLGKGMWKRQEKGSKDWNLCWDFNSKSGCRKGARCKWMHNALHKPQYISATGPGFGYGGFGQQPWMGMQYLPHYGPMGALGLNFAPKPSEPALNISAKSFSPNVWAKEFAPTNDTLYQGSTIKGKNVHAKEFSPVGKGILSLYGKGVPLSGSEKGDSVKAEEFYPRGEGTYSLASTNSGKSRGEKGPDESQTVNRAPEKFTKESQESTSDIVIPSTLKSINENNSQNRTDEVNGASAAVNSICENKSQKMTDGANGTSTKDSVSEKNSQNISDGANEANHAAPELNRTRSPAVRHLKSYGHWDDAFSPLTTPVFEKLPMPQLQNLSPSIMSDGRYKAETPNLKNNPTKMMGVSSPKWSREALKQLRQKMKNNTILKGKSAAKLQPISHEWLPDLNDIPEQFSPWIGQHLGRNGVSPSPSTVLRNPSLMMMDVFLNKNVLKFSKGPAKSENLESAKTATVQNFDVDSAQDVGLITKNSTIEKTSMVDIVSRTHGITGGVIANQESPSERHNKTTTGGLDGKKSKTALQVSENLLQSSEWASPQMEVLHGIKPEGVFSTPIPEPAVVPTQGSYRRSHGGRGKGKMGGRYRMNSKQSGRGRGTKNGFQDGQERSDENHIQSKVSRFPKRGEHSTRGKSNRGRRQRGVGRGGKPRVLRS